MSQRIRAAAQLRVSVDLILEARQAPYQQIGIADHVQRLRDLGISNRAIARQLGVSHWLVARALAWAAELAE